MGAGEERKGERERRKEGQNGEKGGERLGEWFHKGLCFHGFYLNLSPIQKHAAMIIEVMITVNDNSETLRSFNVTLKYYYWLNSNNISNLWKISLFTDW